MQAAFLPLGNEVSEEMTAAEKDNANVPLKPVLRSSKKSASTTKAEESDLSEPREIKRFSLSFRKHKRNALADSKDMEDEPEEDPVLTLLKARATQRVRFSIDANPEAKYEKVDNAPTSNIKKFVKGALFGKKSKDDDDYDVVAAKEIESVKKEGEMVWESAESSAGAEVIRTRSGKNKLVVSFTDDKETRAQVIKLLNKASRAQKVYFQYEYSVKCCMRALELLNKANYPEDHPTVVKTLQSLNSAHHARSSYQNSANIVKMGIKYEDSGDLVRALKMYTIAYRIRRDNLSPNHPSLIVLLNLLGNVQVKRDELEEALEIYELALKDDPEFHDSVDVGEREELRAPNTSNALARGVAYREMGAIYERWGDVEESLRMFHKSLDCVAEYKGISTFSQAPTKFDANKELSGCSPRSHSSPTSVAYSLHDEILLDLEQVQLSRAFEKHATLNNGVPVEGGGDENGGMELLIGTQRRSRDKSLVVTASCYDMFFPPSLEDSPEKRRLSKPAVITRDIKIRRNQDAKGDFADVEVALTLHQIGQLHRAEGEYNLALAAYTVALRGMRHALGKSHPNVAAILGNIGNLQKEMGDMNSAFETYQTVLSMESYRLGVNHPDVVITLHNIATIDAARGNHQNALDLYRQVMTQQETLFGPEHVCISVTSACMGEVYERLGDIEQAVDCFDRALRIKSALSGRHSLEVARLLHKLGKLSVLHGDYHLADSYLSRAMLIYRLNKLPDDDEWVVDANRDVADLDAVIAMGRTSAYEC